MRLSLTLIAAVVPAALCWCSPAFAQLDYMPQVDDMSTVAIGSTSPLGMDSSSSIGGTGIPFGATEIPSAGLSPLATYSTGTIALPSSGTTCPTTGTSTSGLGTADTYDGGGMAMGSATTATAATAGIATMTSTMATSGSTQMAGILSPSMSSTDPGMLPVSGVSTTFAMGTVGVSGMCSSASNGPPTSPSTPMPTVPTTPGGNPRTGIPLGSSEIANLEHRLVSRFEWGLTAELQPPDIETRLAILRKKARALQIKLHDDVYQFLATRIRSNVRRLEGALMRVASFASLSGKELTQETIEHLLKDILLEERRQTVTIEQIQRKVAEHFDVRLADMTSKRRPASIAFPRQVAMYLARELTKASLNEIGDAFGGRDHGTVLHACKLVKKRMKEQDNIRQTISFIDSALQR